MRLHHARIAFPLFRSESADGGSGGGSPNVGNIPAGGERITYGNGQSSAGRGSQFGAESQERASAAAVRLSDDAMVDFGDGKSVKFGDWKNGYVPRGEFEGMQSRYTQGRDYLLGEAKRLETAWSTLAGMLQKQGHPTAGTGQSTDPLAKYKDLAIVDGNTLNEAYNAMREGDLKPMAQMLQNQQQVIEKLTTQVKGLSGSMGSVNEGHAEQAYQQTLNSAIQNLNIPGLDLASPEIRPHAAMLREIAEDVYRSHDPNDPNYAREMPGILRSRLEGLLKLASAVGKVKVGQAKDEKRKFLRPGGNGSGSNGRPYQFENGRQLAARLFDGTNADAT